VVNDAQSVRGHEPPAPSYLGAARLAYFTPVHEQPSLADRKAMFILAASGLMVSVLLFFSGPLGVLVRSTGGAVGAAAMVALFVVAALVLSAAVTSYYSYTRPLPPMPPTLAWFRNVAELQRDEYSTQMHALNHPAAMRWMLHYNYSVASQAARKFRLVNRALKCLRVAIPLWMVLLLALAVWG
jgi:hypothetical protein